MTNQDKYELFKKMQERLDSKEFQDNAVKEIQEYIEKNFVDIKSVNLGDKEIYIIPNPTDKPVKIIYENNGCDNCKEMQIELKKRKLNEMDIEVYECGNCGREFFV